MQWLSAQYTVLHFWMVRVCFFSHGIGTYGTDIFQNKRSKIFLAWAFRLHVNVFINKKGSCKGQLVKSFCAAFQSEAGLFFKTCLQVSGLFVLNGLKLCYSEIIDTWTAMQNCTQLFSTWQTLCKMSLEKHADVIKNALNCFTAGSYSEKLTFNFVVFISVKEGRVCAVQWAQKQHCTNKFVGERWLWHILKGTGCLFKFGF